MRKHIDLCIKMECRVNCIWEAPICLLQRTINHQIKNVGISRLQAGILMKIYEHQPFGFDDFSKIKMNQDSFQAIKYLFNTMYITTSGKSQNKIIITDKGSNICKRIDSLHLQNKNTIQKNFTKTELNELNMSLKKLTYIINN